MSRIGRMPIAVPAKTEVTIADNVVTVKGPLGTLTNTFSTRISVALENNEIIVTRSTDDKEDRALHGLTRALINNMIIGVTQGYSKQLDIIGVGYRAEKQGKKLVLNLGHSHPIYFEEQDGITFELPNNTTVIVKGINKQTVGQVAAVIRSKRPPEPYLGKGVKYTGEKIRRKAGKTGK